MLQNAGRKNYGLLERGEVTVWVEHCDRDNDIGNFVGANGCGPFA